MLKKKYRETASRKNNDLIGEKGAYIKEIEFRQMDAN